MNPPSGPAARLRDVRHAYGRTVALADVTLDLPSGRLVGLIGPDGVGKSTLLGLVAGAKRLQTGTVETLGAAMAEPRQRRGVCHRVAYMPQGLGANLYATLSVAQNLDFFGRLFGHGPDERARRVDDLLTATGLAPFAGRPAGKLSGGMKQKLGLCCALIHDPELLILDEPTTGVDPLSRQQFWDLIGRIRAQRQTMSVLVATGYMDEAERFDWLVALDQGRVLATGAPADLIRRTGATSLEDAFIGLLPAARRAGARAFQIAPRVATSDGPAIQARDLTKRFGDFTAVDAVSFTIEPGEIYGFIGSNGCGKTTTMKMLTGLLPMDDGQASILGRPVDARQVMSRLHVGYMSQSFSLYGELTVRQNLRLHAQLFRVVRGEVEQRVAETIARFGLDGVADELADRLPLGIRQRLSLAVAVIHKPRLLILDEPTSGVDPIARDGFWSLLADLSRDEGVTIFVSTHYMNEAERCDRVALMHAGRVLAEGTPADVAGERGAGSLEDAFIGYLRETDGDTVSGAEPWVQPARPAARTRQRFDPRRAWAYARREAAEILRDPIRLAFALVGPLILMLAFGYGISFDVEDLTYAVLDRDRSPESRTFLENFAGSRYFAERPPLTGYDDLADRLKSADARIAIEIPADFGRHLRLGRSTEIGVWLDGAMPFRAETARGYVEGVFLDYLQDLARRERGDVVTLIPAEIETRFRYNQDFKSIHAIAPGAMMLILMMIPAMMTAVGVVREKELGSITNLYATPVSPGEFLTGKHAPYVAIAAINVVVLLAVILLVFQIPIKGSALALILGAVLYVAASTGFGLVMSSFTRTQIAAIFGTAIITALPTINFSGFLVPVSSLSAGGQAMGALFPTSHFQRVGVGSITKGLGVSELAMELAWLAVFAVGYMVLARCLLRDQGR